MLRHEQVERGHVQLVLQVEQGLDLAAHAVIAVQIVATAVPHDRAHTEAMLHHRIVAVVEAEDAAVDVPCEPVPALVVVQQHDTLLLARRDVLDLDLNRVYRPLVFDRIVVGRGEPAR